jgi:archaellum biogenesis protein FlaJ (TadC family)
MTMQGKSNRTNRGFGAYVVTAFIIAILVSWGTVRNVPIEKIPHEFFTSIIIVDSILMGFTSIWLQNIFYQSKQKDTNQDVKKTKSYRAWLGINVPLGISIWASLSALLVIEPVDPYFATVPLAFGVLLMIGIVAEKVSTHVFDNWVK